MMMLEQVGDRVRNGGATKYRVHMHVRAGGTPEDETGPGKPPLNKRGTLKRADTCVKSWRKSGEFQGLQWTQLPSIFMLELRKPPNVHYACIDQD